MNYRHFFKLTLLITGTGLLFLASCLPERKIATSFQDSIHGMNLLVIPPDYVYKYNHKGEDIEDFDAMKSAAQDSALWVTSRYMQYVSDSIVLDNYMNRFIGELRTLGFNVYLEDAIDSFMTGKPQSYVVDIAQMQLDEYYYPLEDEENFNDTVYKKKVNLDAVDYSCWFDVSKANLENAKKTVLYSTASAYDSFDGRFYNDPFTGAVHYKYKIDSLQLKDVYAMATFLGKRHAIYLYDFFMNHYIAKHLPEGMTMQDYYHYNPAKKDFGSANDDRFEILGSK